MRAKLGLFTREDDDEALVNDLLAWMRRHSADFTNTFRSLISGRPLSDTVDPDADLDAWQCRWKARRDRQPQPPAECETLMRQHDPAFIPRNHKVEEALTAATERNDFSVMEQLLDVLSTPYDHGRDLPTFSEPGPGDRTYRTFCGT
jgi:uncharacterized protein YdiU (UPF0061 family)